MKYMSYVWCFLLLSAPVYAGFGDALRSVADSVGNVVSSAKNTVTSWFSGSSDKDKKDTSASDASGGGKKDGKERKSVSKRSDASSSKASSLSSKKANAKK